MFKRLCQLLSLLLGIVGLLGCAAAAFVVWSATARVSRVTESAFEKVDGGLVAAEKRVNRAQQRVNDLKLTTERIQRDVKQWAQTQSRERLIAKLGVEEKAARLADGIEQADRWMQMAESSMQVVQQLAEVVRSTGAETDTETSRKLLDDLTHLRTQLNEAAKRVETFRARAEEAGDEERRQERIDQLAQLALRVIATFGRVDSRLSDCGERLSEVRTNTAAAKVKALRWLRIAAIGATLLIGWMAAGQASLCYLGWTGLWKRRPDASSHAN